VHNRRSVGAPQRPARRRRAWDLTQRPRIRRAAARSFYEAVQSLRVLLEGGWMVSYPVEPRAAMQLSVACEGGSGKLINIPAYGP
jgi:hypothetical protein